MGCLASHPVQCPRAPFFKKYTPEYIRIKEITVPLHTDVQGSGSVWYQERLLMRGHLWVQVLLVLCLDVRSRRVVKVKRYPIDRIGDVRVPDAFVVTASIAYKHSSTFVSVDDEGSFLQPFFCTWPRRAAYRGCHR